MPTCIQVCSAIEVARALLACHVGRWLTRPSALPAGHIVQSGLPDTNEKMRSVRGRVLAHQSGCRRALVDAVRWSGPVYPLLQRLQSPAQ
jgi:hypothetical protein